MGYWRQMYVNIRVRFLYINHMGLQNNVLWRFLINILSFAPLLHFFKALFVLETFTMSKWLLVMQKNSLTRRLHLIPKFITSQAVQQIFTVHILPSISTSKGNQAMIAFCVWFFKKTISHVIFYYYWPNFIV